MSADDGIVAEILKLPETTTIKEIIEVIEQIWRIEEIPNDWNVALIHRIHKKGAETDYRGIC